MDVSQERPVEAEHRTLAQRSGRPDRWLAARRGVLVALLFLMPLVAYLPALDGGDYQGAWTEVYLTRKFGGTFHPSFLRQLSEKFPDPQRVEQRSQE